MAKICIVLDSDDSIAQLNSKLGLDGTKPDEGMNSLIDYLGGIAGGAIKCSSAQVTTRDSDPGVTTSGSGSAQTNFSNLA